MRLRLNAPIPAQALSSDADWDFLQMGPRETPTCATTSQTHGSQQYAYRICRRGENPWQLREPLLCDDLGFKETRALLLSAVARGNSDKHTSPFLHATRSLKRALWIFQERRHLYSHWLVRWPRQVLEGKCADFQDIAQRSKWLHEDDSDTSLLAEYVQRCRAYTEKDSEIVCFCRPGLEDIDWWDDARKTWHNCLSSATSQEWMSKLVAKHVSSGLAAGAEMQGGASCSEVSPFRNFF